MFLKLRNTIQFKIKEFLYEHTMCFINKENGKYIVSINENDLKENTEIYTRYFKYKIIKGVKDEIFLCKSYHVIQKNNSLFRILDFYKNTTQFNTCHSSNYFNAYKISDNLVLNKEIIDVIKSYIQEDIQKYLKQNNKNFNIEKELKNKFMRLEDIKKEIHSLKYVVDNIGLNEESKTLENIEEQLSHLINQRGE